ncbi:MucBP domain-containing protein [Anaerococcus sp. Marseille-P3625]|uniref:MucBP domain-containing protein n=1 Tax=Anaerococcus sp. Marseille-P3625 TaxID=1977277 RepID=UPI000C077526|nr:MucBP domain-containing protein [Anaerococcus sp. Marseille-P3625]
MKAKKLLAVALAAGMLIGGGTKALDLAIPTAYAQEEKSLDQLKAELKEAQDKKAKLEHDKDFNEKALADTEKLLENQNLDWQRRARLEAYKKSAEENLAKINKALPEVEKQIADLEAKIKNATPAAVFTIEVTTTKPDGSVAKSTVTGKDVEEAKKNVAEKAEKIDGYKVKIDFSADNKTANVTYEKEEKQVKTWDLNTSLQIYCLTFPLYRDVPGATITLTNNETGAIVHTYTTTADGDGYSHADIPEGNYTLTVTSLPTGGILAGKTYVWDGPSSRQVTIPGPASQPFHIKELTTVTYRFKDTEGNVIAPEETTQLDRTGAYQLMKVKGLPKPKAIENYKFLKLEQDGNIFKGSGSFTYIYQKISTKYVDTEGKEIAPEEKGKKDKKDIDGYTYLRTNEDENGSLTHVYIRNLVITVHIYKPRDNRVFKTEWYHSKDYGLDIEHTRGVISNLVAINYSPNYRLEILDNGLTLNYYLLDDSKVAENGSKTEEETGKKPDTKPEDKPEIKPEDEKENSDENKAKDLIDKLNKNTAEIERILKENEANQEKEPDKKPDKKPENKPEKKPEKKDKKSNPKTGVAGISMVAGSLALASAALVATKKKNK